MENLRVGIIIPALNEESTIAKVVISVSKYGVPIVVDDGSTDQTRVKAIESGAIVYSHEKNRGYDSALSSGFAVAHEMGMNYVITIDADGQHNTEMLEKFILELSNQADVVVGSRDKFQRISEKVFSKVSKKIWHISDPLCGMKGYRMSLYVERGAFDTYNSVGTELAIYAASKGKVIKELKILTKDRIGISRFGGTLKANARILISLVHGLIRYGFY